VDKARVQVELRVDNKTRVHLQARVRKVVIKVVVVAPEQVTQAVAAAKAMTRVVLPVAARVVCNPFLKDVKRN
jgi:hypothetical protein